MYKELSVYLLEDDQLEVELNEFLPTLFQTPILENGLNLTVSEKVARLFNFAGRFKSSNQTPSEDNERANNKIISDAVDAGKPISIAAVMGTLLNPDASSPETEEAGLLGALAIERFIQLHNVVQEFYPPGLSVVFFADDWVSHWLFDHTSGHERVATSQSNYLNSFERMLEVLQTSRGISPVQLVRESQVYEASAVTFETYIQECEKYCELFEIFLNESDVLIIEKGCDAYEEEVKNLESFKALQKVGWQGTIPPDMREFYRRRIIRSHQSDEFDSDLQKVNTQLARWFASTLAKHKMKGLDKALRNENGDHPYLRFGFAPQAPGVPKKFYRVLPVSAHPRSDKRLTQATHPFWRARARLLKKTGELTKFRLHEPSMSHQSIVDYEYNSKLSEEVLSDTPKVMLQQVHMAMLRVRDMNGNERDVTEFEVLMVN